jgi:hypothetical protein
MVRASLAGYERDRHVLCVYGRGLDERIHQVQRGRFGACKYRYDPAPDPRRVERLAEDGPTYGIVNSVESAAVGQPLVE